MPTKSMSEDRLVPVRQAAVRLGMSPDTPAVLMARGKWPLPIVRVGKRVMVRLSDLDAFVVANTSNTVASA